MSRIIHHYLDTVDSTNLRIKEMMKSGCPEGTVCSANEQTGGRGRRGHVWLSPKGSSISTSIALYPKNIEVENISRLTLVAAVAVADAIKELYDLDTQIKWPNDIVVNKRKICGILTEMENSVEGEAQVVIGIGINVHTQQFPDEISELATSIDLELEQKDKKSIASRKAIVFKLWDRFFTYYERFVESKGKNFQTDRYNRLLYNTGQEVIAEGIDGSVRGIAKGIDSTGALIIDTVHGTVAVNAGEVSVRGLYGYV